MVCRCTMTNHIKGGCNAVFQSDLVCLCPYTKMFSIKLSIFSYPSVLTYVLGAQKNRLNETVLLSTHNICFG